MFRDVLHFSQDLSFLLVTLFAALYMLFVYPRKIVTELNSTVLQIRTPFNADPDLSSYFYHDPERDHIQTRIKYLIKALKICFKEIRAMDKLNLNALHSQRDCPFLTAACKINSMFCHSSRSDLNPDRTSMLNRIWQNGRDSFP